MLIPLLVFAGMLGTVEPTPVPIFTPTQILAEHTALYENTLNGTQGPLVVRFQVGSIDSQTVIGVDHQRYQQTILHPVSGDCPNAQFYIAITPQAEKAFQRLGVFDLKQHFTGKEIEVRGRLNVTYRAIYASPTFYKYHIDISDLDQFRVVEAVNSKEPDFGFPLPAWRVLAD
ncbi:hypothetical protein [uncultured Gimesia sp.]|jgi:hypothetical protein|uniref:hypothetical protein n=1 Tax=uncultured Gimesia sp. TaxID=1678688 RepID=UPI002635A676|nr:hypothetical protein [uncultured Gimesia sp.]